MSWWTLGDWIEHRGLVTPWQDTQTDPTVSADGRWKVQVIEGNVRVTRVDGKAGPPEDLPKGR